ncbi:alpha/beta hydrolase [Streptococcus respiraculi]|uniref:alpha/beta hydrolase n=1 Tax=Streptococcus respiraculi TaxID=2021971 RepID=UPI000E74D7CB|nr:alpha/beta hydrolase [Streptococcus respiraculi]
MLHDKVYLNTNKTAFVEVYSLDSDISYKVHKKRPAMIICPGGAYLISAIKEGEAVASQFLSQGYSCFVLRYSTFLKDRESLSSECPNIDERAHYPHQILQLLETIHLIHENADEWNIDTDVIFATGFSAGAHIVGTVATRWNDPYFTEKLTFIPNGNELKLAGCVLGYPMLEGPLLEHPNVELRAQSKLMELCLYGHTDPTISEKEGIELIRFISADTSPIFAWHTTGDEVTSARLTTDFISEVQKYDIDAEYHLFSGGQHGLSLSNKLYAKNDSEINSRIGLWLPLVYNWLDYIREELD